MQRSTTRQSAAIVDAGLRVCEYDTLIVLSIVGFERHVGKLLTNSSLNMTLSFKNYSRFR